METGSISALDLKKYQMKALGYDLLKERQIYIDKLNILDNELRNVQIKIKEIEDIKAAQESQAAQTEKNMSQPEVLPIDDIQDIDPSTGEVGRKKKK